jgi:serine/threonine-protein kinase RsbW
MARLFAAAVGRHYSCSEDVVEDLKVAMSEACTNAVKAHERVGADVPIRIVAMAQETSLLFEVIDAGEGIDLDADVLDASATPPVGLFEGSLGLVLIRSLFESVEITRNEHHGTVVRFTAPFGEGISETLAESSSAD